MIVLDTHVLIWLDSADPALGMKAGALIEQTFADDAVAVATTSFWEVSMLIAKGRLQLAGSLDAWRDELLAAGLVELPLDGRIAIAAGALPDFHGDPADRMIIATALAGGHPLVTADRQILGWTGALQAFDARR